MRDLSGVEEQVPESLHHFLFTGQRIIGTGAREEIDGTWIVLQDRTLGTIGRYMNGRKEGTFVERAGPTDIWHITSYCHGRKQGKELIFSTGDGTLIECYYERGVPSGQSIVYKHASTITNVDVYGNTGANVCWYDDGKVRVVAVDGTVTGTSLWLHFGEDGKLDQLQQLVGKKQNGYWELYFGNGMLKSYGPFHEGKPDGTWCEWNEQGHLLGKGLYRQGVPIRGTFRLWEGDKETIITKDSDPPH